MAQDDKEKMNDEEFKERLTPEAYSVLREGRTERAFSGEFYDKNDAGMYKCGACGAQLFSSDVKFTSTMPGVAGWPSFEDALPGAVKLTPDESLGMNRTEVRCNKCDSHLGHLFENIPGEKSKKHYCINSCALDFKPESDTKNT